MIAAVEPHQHALSVDAGDDPDRPTPHRLQVHQGVLRVVDAQVDAVVPVREEQLATVLEVAVDHLDDRLAEVGELLQQLLLHLLELAVEDLPAIRLLIEAVDEQLLLGREVRGEEFVDEGDVVVVLAHLEDLLPAQAELLVPRAAGAQVVALVLPLLFLEPLALVEVVGERLLLAGEAEADLVQKFLSARTKNIYVPATILLRPATAENPEVQQEQLHLLAHHFARGAENDTLLSRVAIAVEVGPEKCSDYVFRRP